jgi:hypothetical protein
MLLTGFDAPIEQVMYIDKKIQEHSLLQAIARTNRVKRGKQRGYVVDYIGLTDNLTAALTLYAATDEQQEIDPKVPPVELLSTDFIDRLNQHAGGNIEAKASEMEHAIRKHCTVHNDEDPAFYQSMSQKVENPIDTKIGGRN